MLHPGPLVASEAIDVAVEPGASTALDLAAASDASCHGFLRAAWFAAAAGEAEVTTLSARDGQSGEPLAAIPLTLRRLGPLSIREVPGSYWPYRSFPLAAGASAADLAALLGSPEARRLLGWAWRIGPILEDDPAFARLVTAAGETGWTLLRRSLGTCFVVDPVRLGAEGPWPSTKTLRKNRWLERRLAEAGALEFGTIRGEGWTNEAFDLLAGIEAESWVGRQADACDTKFLHAAGRRIWENAIADPEIAGRLGASILHVGGVPAAFTFWIDCGDVFHFIANSYSERFADRSPGRILLYRDLQGASQRGVARIGWGAGDPGYKREMGAEPGPEIIDLLLVRGPIASFARPLWRTRG